MTFKLVERSGPPLPKEVELSKEISYTVSRELVKHLG